MEKQDLEINGKRLLKNKSMREIKFRCFEKEKGMWGQDSNSAMNLAMFWAFVADIKGNPNVMQYTGLKDKNGKEIYEGDIVRDLDNNLISEIEWEIAGFMQRIRVAYEKLGKENYRKPEYEGGITGLADGKGLEIIGNIYENPDLLSPTE